jgi:hypothetical protein
LFDIPDVPTVKQRFKPQVERQYSTAKIFAQRRAGKSNAVVHITPAA